MNEDSRRPNRMLARAVVHGWALVCFASVALTSESHVHKRTISRDPDTVWPKAIIPYTYTSSVDETAQKEIQKAMAIYHKMTCLRFVPWTTVGGQTTNERLGLGHTSYLKFVKRDDTCWSGQGKQDLEDGQEISCCNAGTCVHELGHALGEMHEHQSPHPDRNRFIRINYQYIDEAIRTVFRQSREDEQISYGFDFNSYMTYGANEGDGGDTITYLFPDLTEKANVHYQMKEISFRHKCQDQCSDFTMTCENEGFLTKVDNKCACACIPGLDPATGCRDVYRQYRQGSLPGGQYALPAPKTGCPDGTFLRGSRKRYSDGGNYYGFAYSLKGQHKDNMLVEHFCVRDSPPNGVEWPDGNYCVYRVGGQCPPGFSLEGSVQYDDNPTFRRPNTVTGRLPDGVFGDDTKYYYCCKNTGIHHFDLEFPTKKSFVLIKAAGYMQCQNVKGMELEVDEVLIYNTKTGGQTIARLEGDNPAVEQDGFFSSYTIFYCVYKALKPDCGGVFELDSSNKEITFSSPDGRMRECYWLFKAPKGERLSLDFTQFDIYEEVDYGRCHDEVEVHYVHPPQPGTVYCGKKVDDAIISVYNTIYVRLTTSSPDHQSSFTATVKLIQNEDLCYEISDRGMSYVGDINFTRFRKPCLPWHEMTHCEAHPFRTDVYNTVLTGNACRTPDQATAFVPWCYIERDTCARDYCDVCLKGKIVDRASDCEQRKARGECDIYECTKTCMNNAEPVKVSEIRCGAPQDAPDGRPVNAKSSYKVGETVLYRCNNKPSETKERRCLTSGQWDTMGQVCSKCSPGWSMNEGTQRCYKHYDLRVDYTEAQQRCASEGATLATSKSQEENDFLHTLVSYTAWIGLSDAEQEGNWMFVDGDSLASTGYSNWLGGSPENTYSYDDCVWFDEEGYWTDEWCAYLVSFVCMKHYEEVNQCLDFWDKCPDMLQIKPSMCTEFPSFASEQCSATCGFC